MSFIYVLRHAQSIANANPLLYGTMVDQDIPLSEEGKQEAASAAQLIQRDIGKSIAIFSSHYLRAVQTAEIIGETTGHRKVKQNVFLAEKQAGDQDGCNDIDNFDARPLEKAAYKKAGHLTYTPIRGESFLDVQLRMALFVLQQDSFRYFPAVVIVSHRDACLALHSYFTGETPNTGSHWRNCEIRKYVETEPPAEFVYEGQLT